MKLYSTNDRDLVVPLKEAVLRGMPADGGLYMPENFPRFGKEFFENIHKRSFETIAFEVSNAIFKGAIPERDLRTIVEEAINFPAPLKHIVHDLFLLELFHGPSLAFKDFGARFMAQLMSYYNRGEDKNLVILVATSGDTGGAVAAGFYDTPGITVVILYPSGKVSKLQELQLTTFDKNIMAIEVDGSFDDCQSLVKKAFQDEELRRKIRLTSANSINIARLIPQSFYYFEAFRQLQAMNAYNEPPSFIVPSGNFGNLTAGVFAMEMGLPVDWFVAATNINDVVPLYLKTGDYVTKRSVRTLSNAMDVGAPSNFSRLFEVFTRSMGRECSTWNNMQRKLLGYSFDDRATSQMMRQFLSDHQYFLDPHTAVGVLAYQAFKEVAPGNAPKIVLGTAHPIKFMDETKDIYKGVTQVMETPQQVRELHRKSKHSIKMEVSYTEFKDWLLESKV